MKYNENADFFSAKVDICTINTESYKSYFIADVRFDFENIRVEEMMYDDIVSVLVTSPIVDELWNAAPNSETMFTLEFRFQYSSEHDYFSGEEETYMAYRYQILESKPCDYDKEFELS